VEAEAIEAAEIQIAGANEIAAECSLSGSSTPSHTSASRRRREGRFAADLQIASAKPSQRPRRSPAAPAELRLDVEQDSAASARMRGCASMQKRALGMTQRLRTLKLSQSSTETRQQCRRWETQGIMRLHLSSHEQSPAEANDAAVLENHEEEVAVLVGQQPNDFR
jgi:hypothetical protein